MLAWICRVEPETDPGEPVSRAVSAHHTASTKAVASFLLAESAWNTEEYKGTSISKTCSNK